MQDAQHGQDRLLGSARVSCASTRQPFRDRCDWGCRRTPVRGTSLCEGRASCARVNDTTTQPGTGRSADCAPDRLLHPDPSGPASSHTPVDAEERRRHRQSAPPMTVQHPATACARTIARAHVECSHPPPEPAGDTPIPGERRLCTVRCPADSQAHRMLLEFFRDSHAAEFSRIRVAVPLDCYTQVPARRG